jgi:hypothetical protein
MEKPQLDESKAAEYIGKTVLLGVTYLDHEGKLIEQRQWVGTILTFSNARAFESSCETQTSPMTCLPIPVASARQSREFID